jgi:myo-inositol 2-dehydrogenase / D-chiro-inositol 1-dehydrogenase
MGAERAQASQRYGAEVAAVTDTDAAKANAFALAHSAKAFPNVEDLPWSAINALFVCTPPSFRSTPVRCAVRNRMAIFVEKPLAIDASAARELLSLVDGLAAPTAVGYMNRYRASTQRTKELIRSESLVGISCNWASKTYEVPWWSNPRQSGGPINEQATHVVDLCRYLAGEITEVEALGGASETRLAVALRFASGALATLLYTCEAPEKHIDLLAVTTSGCVRLSGWDFSMQTNTIDGSLHPNDDSPYYKETAAFLEAARLGGGDAVLCDFADAYRTQVVVDQIRERLKTRLCTAV